MRCKTLPVIDNIKIQNNLYKMTLPFPHPAKAGQFVMVQKEGSKFLLSRAISISDIVDEQLILIYQAVGRATNELALIKKGDLVSLTGPIGHGFPVDDFKPGDKIALVGGGVGTAPLVLTAKVLKQKGILADAHIAFRDKSILQEELAPYCENVFVSTESGSEGNKGFVTGTLNTGDYDAVFCCGPSPMMSCVVDLCKNTNTPVFISMENRMACGIGVCLVCTCTDKNGKNHRTCLDGPVFNGLEVDFNA